EQSSAATVYQARVQETVEKLTAELQRFSRGDRSATANPVRDYLATRSLFTSGESMLVTNFGPNLDEQVILHTERELTLVGTTGSHCTQSLVDCLEAGQRKAPLSVQLFVLDPEERNGWRFLYYLREGRHVTEEELTEFLEEDLHVQQRGKRLLGNLVK